MSQHPQPEKNGDGPDPLALVREGWEALVRHRVRAGQVFVAIVALGVVGALLLPRVYESQAKLMVKIGRESVTLDPTATVGQTLSVYDSRETEVNTILEILGSRAVLEDVVRTVGPDLVLRDTGDADDPKRIGEAVKELEDATAVLRGKKSNIVSVHAESYTPETAQRIATAMLEAFRGRYLVANRTAGSYEFFVEQERVVAERLAAALSELNAARDELGIVSVAAERRRLESRLGALETDRATNAAALAASRSRINALTTTIATLPERRVDRETRGFAEDGAGRTMQQLGALRLQEHDLLTRFKPTHPDVEAVRERIERAERVLTSPVAAEMTQTTTAAHPARQQLEIALLIERSNVESYAGRAGELADQRTAVNDRLQAVNAAEVGLTRLSQNVDRLRADHRDYTAKLEQARIDLALAEERISNVNVWQPPTLASKAMASNRRLIVLLAVFVATLTAIGTAFLLEFLDRRRRRGATGARRSEQAVGETTSIDTATPGPLGLAKAMNH